jgi:hypothetical protein
MAHGRVPRGGEGWGRGVGPAWWFGGEVWPTAAWPWRAHERRVAGIEIGER